MTTANDFAYVYVEQVAKPRSALLHRSQLALEKTLSFFSFFGLPSTRSFASGQETSEQCAVCVIVLSDFCERREDTKGGPKAKGKKEPDRLILREKTVILEKVPCDSERKSFPFVTAE